MNFCKTINVILKTLVFVLVLEGLAVSAKAQTQDEEANLKAVFIYNFTKYIDWDNPADEGDFVIGIIGSSPVAASLAEIAKSNTIKNKRIVIRNFSRPEDIGYCNILFIPKKLPFTLHSILEQLGRGVLTISEEDGDASLGTAFNFVVVNDKLKFESNLKAISQAGLKASSQLLKLAIIVN